MTREEAISHIEYSIKAYQNLIDNDVRSGEAIGKDFKGEWETNQTLADAYKTMIESLEMAIQALSQEQKSGKWIKSRDCYGNHHFTCSECGNDIATQYADNWNDKYCSECGARMESDANE